jgi:hypothetical protein
MITYSARTMDGETFTVQCSSRDAALDLAEGDLRNGTLPLMLEVCGVRHGPEYIVRLMFKRWAGQRRAR